MRGRPHHQSFLPSSGNSFREQVARRRLRAAAHADEDHIGGIEILRKLPIIMQHGVVQRVDALEIFGVEDMQRTGARRRFGAEISAEQGRTPTELLAFAEELKVENANSFQPTNNRSTSATSSSVVICRQ